MLGGVWDSGLWYEFVLVLGHLQILTFLHLMSFIMVLLLVMRLGLGWWDLFKFGLGAVILFLDFEFSQN